MERAHHQKPSSAANIQTLPGITQLLGCQQTFIVGFVHVSLNASGKKKRLILFKVAFTVTLQLVTANCHLLGWASDCVIRKSVHLSWAIPAFFMLSVHNLPSYLSLQSQPPCLLLLKPVLPGRRRQILIHEVPLAGEVETAV